MKTQIETALFEAVEALSAANPTLLFQYPNLTFNQPDNGNFIEVVHTPNTTENTVLDNDDPGLNQGFLRLLVHYPKNIGTIIPQTIVDIILAWFAKGTILRNGGISVKVYRPPWSNGAVTTDDERFIPVIIPYQTEGN